MSIEKLMALALCGVALGLLRTYFVYRHRDRRDEVRPRATFSSVSVSQPEIPEDQPSGQMQAQEIIMTGGDEDSGLLAGLPANLQQLVQNSLGGKKGLASLGGDFHTVTTVTSGSKSYYQFTDAEGKVHGYSSLDEMEPELKVMFETNLDGLGLGFGANQPPATSAEETLAKNIGTTTVSPSATDAVPRPDTKPDLPHAAPKKLAYIPLEPEDPTGDDQGGES